jgi:hypothetical protein
MPSKAIEGTSIKHAELHLDVEAHINVEACVDEREGGKRSRFL